MAKQDTKPNIDTRPLSELRRTSQAEFERLTDVLGEVHGGLSTIATDISRLNALLAEVEHARRDIGKVRSACVMLAEHLKRSHRAIMATAFPPAILNGTDAAETLRLECRQLRAIASMTRVAGRTADVEEIEDYIVSLRTMIHKLENTSQAMWAGLVRIETAVHKAATSLADATLFAQQALEPPQAAASAVDIRELSTVTELLESRLRSSTLDNTAVLMNGIQFSDAFAQRIEHVEVILAAAPGHEGSSKLAAAQLSALCGDADALLTTTQTALRHLGTEGQLAAQALAGDIGSQVAGVLAAWQAELDEGQALDRIVTPALQDALTAVAAIDSAVNESGMHLETLSTTAQDVRLSAINSGLLARRSGHGAGQRAMAVLSTTVQERAQVCSALNLRCRDSFSTITELTAEAAFSDLVQEVENLTTHITEASDDFVRVTDLFVELERLKKTAEDSALKLQQAVDNGLLVLSGLPVLVEQIRSHEAGSRYEEAGTVDSSALEVFKKLYTMDRERDVHAKLVGDEPTLTAPAEQLLDDMFF